ncbi:hypothetical protein PO124_13580 [Bacillus licheniformis]|nr:hypothetical protein [Bacillus licheniformis]
MAPGTEGGYTTYWPTGEVMSIYDACMKYKEDGTGLVVIAGKTTEWVLPATGRQRNKSARHQTVIAESFERIHRSNLVLMGVLPLQFKEGENAETLGLTGKETIEVDVSETVRPRDLVQVKAIAEDGTVKSFEAVVRFDSEVEIDYYRHGGILQMVLRNKMKQ